MITEEQLEQLSFDLFRKMGWGYANVADISSDDDDPERDDYRVVALKDHLAEAEVVREHSAHRGWELHAVAAQWNPIHAAVTIVPETGDQNYPIADGMKRVGDQLKANATRVWRQGENPIRNKKVK